MKTLKITIALLLSSGFILSFTIPNNFIDEDTETSGSMISQDLSEDLSASNDQIDPQQDTLRFEQVNKLVTHEVIDPIVACFEKKDPHMFMSKCFTRVYFRLSHDQLNRRLYKDQLIRGSIYLTDCSVNSRLVDVLVDFERGSIKIKESYRTEPVHLKTFLSDICAYVEKNGIPNR